MLTAIQIIKTTLLDSGETCHFNKPSDGCPIIGPSDKMVAVASGEVANTFSSSLLPMMQLCPEPQYMHHFPALSTTLYSVFDSFQIMDTIPFSMKTTRAPKCITIMTSRYQALNQPFSKGAGRTNDLKVGKRSLDEIK